jgi:hypothetical protein
MTDLERMLHELAPHVDYPPEPDLVRSVRARIEAAAPPSQRRILPHVPRRAALAGVMVLLAAVITSLVALPGLRAAVADWLGLGGVRIHSGGPSPTPAGESLDLGEALSVEQAQGQVDFDVAVPDALGEPNEVFFDELVPGGQVALVYRTRPGLPATPGSDVGLLVTEFEGSVDEILAKKIISTDPGTELEQVAVGGSTGLWISGEPHFITYMGPDGQPREETVRLVGNVLLWERNGVTFRIESALSKGKALHIARSLKPVRASP